MFFGSAIVLASVSLNWVNFSNHLVTLSASLICQVYTNIVNMIQCTKIKLIINLKFTVMDLLLVTLLMPKLKIDVAIPALTQN
jgi:hypothetical protein